MFINQQYINEKIENSHFYCYDNLDKVYKYLNSGIMIMASPSIIMDKSDSEVMGTSSVVTDGLWYWVDSLPNFIKKYEISLPIEFLSRIESVNYNLKPVDNIDNVINNFLNPNN